MKPSDRRAYLEAVMQIPARERAWLESDRIELFAWHGWGIMLNDAQLEAIAAFLHYPPGTIHLWRWANRTGKTTLDVIIHLWACWKKWRYEAVDFDDKLGFKYRTLHSTPLNRLNGKAWELVDAMIAGNSWQQRDPIRGRQRPALLAPFYTARSGKLPDNSEGLWVECANNSVVDMLSTHDGAGRMESEAWWVITWDEFSRQQPVEDILVLFQQTFLPRSSDFMAPVVMSSTVTEDAEPIYQELEDLAAENPRDWCILTFGREANFAASQESIDRQRRLTFDQAFADRSLDGGIGGGGRGTLYPHWQLASAFDAKMPTDYSDAEIAGLRARGFEFITSFDHAAAGDLNVATTVAVPWPVPTSIEDLIGSCIGVGLEERRSGSHLTPTLQTRFAIEAAERFDSRFLIVDSTAEGGELVFRGLREAYGRTVIPCAFNARMAMAISKNKELGLQALQRQFGYGLELAVKEDGWLEGDAVPEAANRPGTFGIWRFPFTGRWLKLRRELAVLRRDDEKQRQDRAMTVVMLAWWLNKHVGSVRSQPTPFSIVGRRRPRDRRRVPGMAIVR